MTSFSLPGFLWNAPVALILPTLAPKEGDIFNQHFRRGETVPDEEETTENSVAEEGSEDGGFFSGSARSLQVSYEMSDDLNVDPGYRKQTDKLLTFFSILKV